MLLQPEEESVNSGSRALRCAVSTPTRGCLQEHRDCYLPVLSTVAVFQSALLLENSPPSAKGFPCHCSAARAWQHTEQANIPACISSWGPRLLTGHALTET